jgi:integrase
MGGHRSVPPHRVEELLELSHQSLIQYRLPSTDELVPLLQIAPSKTDAERLLVVSPELADVLSAVIRRLRGADGAIPLVRARDSHELVWLPPSPLLFQRRTRAENRSLGGSFVAQLLDEALAHTGLTDPAGEPLHFAPHDFRRMFITDAVLNGLPPHTAQVIAGHRDIGVTMGYKAVYPNEAITAPPRLHRPSTQAPADRGIPPAHRRRMATVHRPLRAPQGLRWHLWSRVRNTLHP